MSNEKANRLILRMLAGAFAPLLLACLAAGQSTDKNNNDGKSAYATVCAGCHGLDGKGGERAPDIATRPRVRGLSDEAILHILQDGVPNTSMPPFRTLGLEKLHSLVTHVRQLQGLQNVEAIRGDADRGRHIFFSKGGCANCHMLQGSGGFYGSDLSGYAQGRAPDDIRQAIIAPDRDIDPRRRIVVATTSQGEIFMGLARNEDNFSLQLLTPDGTLHLLYKSSLAKLAYREESAMPSDYLKRLSAQELDDLVKFLASVADSQSGRQHREDREE